MRVKNFILFSLLFGANALIGSEADAQKINNLYQNGDKYQATSSNQKTIVPVFHKPLKNKQIKAKGEATDSRLFSYVNLFSDGENFIPHDSTKIYWHGEGNSTWLRESLLDSYFHPVDQSLNEPTLRGLSELLLIDSSLNFEWNVWGLGFYVVKTKTITTLGVTGNVIAETSWWYNDSVWVNYYQNLYTYDNQGNRLSEVSQVWVDSNWENRIKYDFTYDANNRITTESTRIWDTINKVWQNTEKWNYDYNSQDIRILLVYQNWENAGGSWQNITKIERSYYGDLKIGQTTFSWNPLTKKWVNSLWSEYQYNNKDQRTTEIKRVWATDSSRWEKDTRLNYVYDAVGNNVDLIIQKWNFYDDNWRHFSREEYQFNGEDPTELILSNWDSAHNSFIYHTLLEYNYNTKNQCTDVSQYTWDADSIHWMHIANNPQIKFFYDELSDSTGNGNDSNTVIKNIVLSKDILLYPNPAVNEITLKLNNGNIHKVSIYNSIGQLVYQNTGKLNAKELKLPVHQLSNGVYYLEVFNEQLGKGSKSFVIQR